MSPASENAEMPARERPVPDEPGARVKHRRPPRAKSVARDYAALALERFSHDTPPVFRLQKPFGYNHVTASPEKGQKSKEQGWTHPVRVAEECSMCRDCETECPTQAFDADTGRSDPEKCIECMHCVYICPDQVLKIDERMKDAHDDLLAYWHLTEEIMNEKKSRIITAAWEAAC